jgi:hypothetical protein
MNQDFQPSKPFEDFRNITVGLARVIYEGDSWYGLSGWRLPGRVMTQDRDKAYACAVEMNRLMGGVQVVQEPAVSQDQVDWAVGVITRNWPTNQTQGG